MIFDDNTGLNQLKITVMKREFNPELKAILANNKNQVKAKSMSENKYIALIIGTATIVAVILSACGLIK